MHIVQHRNVTVLTDALGRDLPVALGRDQQGARQMHGIGLQPDAGQGLVDVGEDFVRGFIRPLAGIPSRIGGCGRHRHAGHFDQAVVVDPVLAVPGHAFDMPLAGFTHRFAQLGKQPRAFDAKLDGAGVLDVELGTHSRGFQGDGHLVQGHADGGHIIGQSRPELATARTIPHQVTGGPGTGVDGGVHALGGDHLMPENLGQLHILDARNDLLEIALHDLHRIDAAVLEAVVLGSHAVFLPARNAKTRTGRASRSW